MKNEINAIADALARLREPVYPSLGLDLDGTIDEAPIFFQILSNLWPGDVYVITYRRDRAQAEADLVRQNIKYNHLILVDSLEEKAQVITDHGIYCYFDDQDEAILGIRVPVAVFKVRNGGNFDFDEKRWIYSDKTGRKLWQDCSQ